MCASGRNDDQPEEVFDFAVDGSIVPANPGINPSLTIAALAEHAMSQIPVKSGFSIREAIEAGDRAVARLSLG